MRVAPGQALVLTKVGANPECTQCSGRFSLAWAQVLLLQPQGTLEASPDTSITHHGRPVMPPCLPMPLFREALEAALQKHRSGHLCGYTVQRWADPPGGGHRGQNTKRLGHGRMG